MSRSVTRKAQSASASEREGGVVRAEKVVPAIKHPAPVDEDEPFEAPPPLPCSGRCGHCDCHPCRLHAPI